MKVVMVFDLDKPLKLLWLWTCLRKCSFILWYYVYLSMTSWTHMLLYLIFLHNQPLYVSMKEFLWIISLVQA